MHSLIICFRPDLTRPPSEDWSLVVGELVLDGGRVVRLDWNRDRDLLNLDPMTDRMFDDFPWLVRRVLEQDQPADAPAHLLGLFAWSVLSVSGVAVA